jgi:antitoxin ChpS
MQTVTTSLRKVGGSVMLTVPPSYLEQLQLRAGAEVGLSLDNGRLMVDPKPRPKYTLSELLAASDYSQAQAADDREWVDAPTVGRELC